MVSSSTPGIRSTALPTSAGHGGFPQPGTSATAPDGPCGATRFPPLRRETLLTLQVNLGYRCNQSCSHCHVGAGPTRTEAMAPQILRLIPEVLRARGIETLDITGGAPELHPGFRDLVRTARRLGVVVIDRCNLTILSEPGQEDLADFLAEQGVTVVASLPCYEPGNVDRQRGDGVFARSIEGLRRLNAVGYGQGTLPLHLVYNPQGPVLPPPQVELEADYRRVLARDWGIQFDQLYALANMPIQRFATALQLSGQLDGYLELLKRNHQPANVPHVMCRHLISVDWQGCLHDCDFNQMLRLGMASPAPRHLRDLLEQDPAGTSIRVADHCYGCTAGHGSSCGGALAAA